MHRHDTPYLTPVKRHVICLWCQGRVLCARRFSQRWGSIYSIFFCMRCGPNDWQPHTRGRGAAFAWPCWCSSPPPLPPISTLSYAVAKKIAAFSNSTVGLPPGFCGSECFMCTFFHSSILTYLSVFISVFSSAASLFSLCSGLSSYLPLFTALTFISHGLSIIWSCSLCIVTLSSQFIFTPLPLLWDSEETADLYTLTVQEAP